MGALRHRIGNANEREFVEEAEVLCFFGEVNVVCVRCAQMRELFVFIGHGKYMVCEMVKVQLLRGAFS